MIWDLAHLPQEQRTTAKEQVLTIGPLLLFDCTVFPPQKYSNLLADIRGDIGFLFGEFAVLLSRFPCRRQARTAVPNTLLGASETETEIMSIPACRKTLRAGKNDRYFNLKHLKIYTHLSITYNIS
jgi:hypothetical protein